jgi:hypothetical protein
MCLQLMSQACEAGSDYSKFLRTSRVELRIVVTNLNAHDTMAYISKELMRLSDPQRLLTEFTGTLHVTARIIEVEPLRYARLSCLC